jgi:hypothetical protein
LPKLKAFIWLVVASIAFIAWHAYQYQLKGVVPGAEADKMPPAVYGAIVAVLCAVFFGWFAVEWVMALARQFQSEAPRPPWHRTKHRWIAPATHVALGAAVFVFLCMGSFAFPYGARDTGQFIADARDKFSKPPGDLMQVAEAAPEAQTLDKPVASTMPDESVQKSLAKDVSPTAPVVTGSLPPRRKRKAAAPQPIAHYPLDPLFAKIGDLFEGLLGTARVRDER